MQKNLSLNVCNDLEVLDNMLGIIRNKIVNIEGNYRLNLKPQKLEKKIIQEKQAKEKEIIREKQAKERQVMEKMEKEEPIQ